MVSTNIHWIRHGQSAANAGQMKHMNTLQQGEGEVNNAKLKVEMYKIMNQYPDAELTEQGRQEALETRKTMEACPTALCVLFMTTTVSAVMYGRRTKWS